MPTSRDIDEIKNQEAIDNLSPLRRSTRIAKCSPAPTIVTRRTSNASEDNNESDTPVRRTRRRSLSQEQRPNTPIKKQENTVSEPKKTRGRRSSLSERTSSLESVNEIPTQQKGVRTRRSSVTSITSISEEIAVDSDNSLSNQIKNDKKPTRKSMRLTTTSLEKEKLEVIPELNTSQENNSNNKSINEKSEVENDKKEQKMEDIFDEPMEIDDEYLSMQIEEHNLSKDKDSNNIHEVATQPSPLENNIKKVEEAVESENKETENDESEKNVVIEKDTNKTEEKVVENDEVKDDVTIEENTTDSLRDVKTTNPTENDIKSPANKTSTEEDIKLDTTNPLNNVSTPSRSSPLVGSPKKYFLRNTPKLSDDESNNISKGTVKSTPKMSDDENMSLNLQLSSDTSEKSTSKTIELNTSAGSDKENKSQNVLMDVTVNLRKSFEVEHLLQKNLSENERSRRFSTPLRKVAETTKLNSAEKLSKSLSLEAESEIISNLDFNGKIDDNECSKEAKELENSLEAPKEKVMNDSHSSDNTKLNKSQSKDEEIAELIDASHKEESPNKANLQNESVELNTSNKKNEVEQKLDVTNSDIISPTECNESIESDRTPMNDENELEIIDIPMETNDEEDEPKINTDLQNIDKDKDESQDEEIDIISIDTTNNENEKFEPSKANEVDNSIKSLELDTSLGTSKVANKNVSLNNTRSSPADNKNKRISLLSTSFKSQSTNDSLNKSAKIQDELNKSATKINVEEKIDKMLDNLISNNEETNNSSENEDEEDIRRSEFIDDMAEVPDNEEEEDGDDTDLNVLIDVGESIHSSESRSTESSIINSNDSFIVDDEIEELLSGDENYLGLKLNTKQHTKKRRSRIIRPSVSDSDTENNEVILEKLEASFKDITPDDVKDSIDKSATISAEETVSLIQKEDNQVEKQHSNFEVKSPKINNTSIKFANESTPLASINTSLKAKISPLSSSKSSTPRIIIKENVKLEDIADVELKNKIKESIEKRLSLTNDLTPNKSNLQDGSICNISNTSVTLQQNVPVEEIKTYSNKIKDIFDTYYSSLKENNDINGQININLSIDFEPTPKIDGEVSSAQNKSNNVTPEKETSIKGSPLKISPSKKVLFTQEPIEVKATTEFNATIFKDFYISTTSSAPYIFSKEKLSQSSDCKDYNVSHINKQMPSTVNANVYSQVMQFGNYFDEESANMIDESTSSNKRLETRASRRKRKLADNVQDVIETGIQTRNKTKRNDVMNSCHDNAEESKVSYFPKDLLNKLDSGNEVKQNELSVTKKSKQTEFVTKINEATLSLKVCDSSWISAKVSNLKPSKENKTVESLKRKRHFDIEPEVSQNDFKSKTLYDGAHVQRVNTDVLLKKKSTRQK